MLWVIVLPTSQSDSVTTRNFLTPGTCRRCRHSRPLPKCTRPVAGMAQRTSSGGAYTLRRCGTGLGRTHPRSSTQVRRSRRKLDTPVHHSFKTTAAQYYVRQIEYARLSTPIHTYSLELCSDWCPRQDKTSMASIFTNLAAQRDVQEKAYITPDALRWASAVLVRGDRAQNSATPCRPVWSLAQDSLSTSLQRPPCRVTRPPSQSHFHTEHIYNIFVTYQVCMHMIAQKQKTEHPPLLPLTEFKRAKLPRRVYY